MTYHLLSRFSIIFAYRTHQLRVHMAHIGHPILGDTLYPIPEEFQQVIREADKTADLDGEGAKNTEDSAQSNIVDSASIVQAGVFEISPVTAATISSSTTTAPLSIAATEEAEMLELLDPLENRVILTTKHAPAQSVPRVDSKYPRLCLHALRLSFTHPTTRLPITLSALTTESHMVQAPVSAPLPLTGVEEEK